MNRPDYSPQLDDKQTGVKGARYTLYRERFEELLRAQLAWHFGDRPLKSRALFRALAGRAQPEPDSA